MRTNPSGPPTGLALVVILATACGPGAGLDASALPDHMRAPYQRFEARCSRCHSLSRPLSAPVNDADHWRKYIARMRRMPGSGINEEDGRVILTFLAYYTHVVRGVPTTDARGDAPTSGAEEGASEVVDEVLEEEPRSAAPALEPVSPESTGGMDDAQ